MPITLTSAKKAAAKPPAAVVANPSPEAADAPKAGTVKLTAPKGASKAAKAAEKAAQAPEAAPETAAPSQAGAALAKATAVEPKATVEVELTKNNYGNKDTVSIETKQEAVDLPDHIDRVVAATPCVVSYGLGYTQGMPDYCSAKGSVSVSIPCRHDQIDAVADYAKEWVNARLTTVAQELMQMADDAIEQKKAAQG